MTQNPYPPIFRYVMYVCELMIIIQDRGSTTLLMQKKLCEYVLAMALLEKCACADSKGVNH